MHQDWPSHSTILTLISVLPSGFELISFRYAIESNVSTRRATEDTKIEAPKITFHFNNATQDTSIEYHSSFYNATKDNNLEASETISYFYAMLP